MSGDVTAAIERLREWASDPGTWDRDRDVLAVLAEVERLRAEVERLTSLAQSYARRGVERETLSSEETRNDLVIEVAGRAYQWADDFDPEKDYRAEARQIVMVVLSVLTADPEVDRGGA